MLLRSALWSQPDQSARAKGSAGAGTWGLCQQLWACAQHMQRVPVYVTLSQHLLLWGQEAVGSRWIRASLGPTISIRKSDRTQEEMLGGGAVGLAANRSDNISASRLQLCTTSHHQDSVYMIV